MLAFQIAVFIVSLLVFYGTFKSKQALSTFDQGLFMFALLGFFWTVISFIMGMF